MEAFLKELEVEVNALVSSKISSWVLNFAANTAQSDPSITPESVMKAWNEKSDFKVSLQSATPAPEAKKASKAKAADKPATPVSADTEIPNLAGLKKMTVKDLKTLAEAHKINLPTKARKETIVETIDASRSGAKTDEKTDEKKTEKKPEKPAEEKKAAVSKDDIPKMTVVKLREYAKEHDIKITSKMKKDEIITTILKEWKDPEPEEEAEAEEEEEEAEEEDEPPADETVEEEN